LTVVSLDENGRPLKTQCIVNISVNFESLQGVRETVSIQQHNI